MSRDSFGHISIARHFQSVARRELASAKTAYAKEILRKRIEESEQRIRYLEAAEAEFWNSLSASSDGEPA